VTTLQRITIRNEEGGALPLSPLPHTVHHLDPFPKFRNNKFFRNQKEKSEKDRRMFQEKKNRERKGSKEENNGRKTIRTGPCKKSPSAPAGDFWRFYACSGLMQEHGKEASPSPLLQIQRDGEDSARAHHASMPSPPTTSRAAASARGHRAWIWEGGVAGAGARRASPSPASSMRRRRRADRGGAAELGRGSPEIERTEEGGAVRGEQEPASSRGRRARGPRTDAPPPCRGA
jgi:hypothetical protein